SSLLMEVMLRVYDLLSAEGVGIHDLAMSPIRGHKGNVEFLALLKRGTGMDKELYKHRIHLFLG
ncbi:MAG: TlyA family RNA methyltransferase, partial [Sphaerochaetaceae bacterium]